MSIIDKVKINLKENNYECNICYENLNLSKIVLFKCKHLCPSSNRHNKLSYSKIHKPFQLKKNVKKSSSLNFKLKKKLVISNVHLTAF